MADENRRYDCAKFVELLREIGSELSSGEGRQPAVSLMFLTEASFDLVELQLCGETYSERLKARKLREASFDMVDERAQRLFLNTLDDANALGFKSNADRNIVVQVSETLSRALSMRWTIRTRSHQAMRDQLNSRCRLWCKQLGALIKAMNHVRKVREAASKGQDKGGNRPRRGNQPLTLKEFHEALKLAEDWQIAYDAASTTKEKFCERYGNESKNKLKRLQTGLTRRRILLKEWKKEQSPSCKAFIESEYKEKPDATPDLLAALAKRLEYAVRQDAEKQQV